MITPHCPLICRTPSTRGGRHVVEGFDELESHRFPVGHELGYVLVNMGSVKFADILSALEDFGLVAASDTGPQFELAGHLDAPVCR